MKWKRGITREVFVFKTVVIKTPSIRSWKCFLRGLLINMSEAAWGKAWFPELAPVRFSLPGGWLLIMDRVGVLPRVLAPEELNILKNSPIPLLNNSHNFGHLPDGRLVAIDYGHLG